MSVPARPGFRPGCLFFSYVFSMKAGTPATVLPWSERKFPPLRAKWYTPRGIWLISCLMRAVRKVSSAVDVGDKLNFIRLNYYLKKIIIKSNIKFSSFLSFLHFHVTHTLSPYGHDQIFPVSLLPNLNLFQLVCGVRH